MQPAQQQFVYRVQIQPKLFDDSGSIMLTGFCLFYCSSVFLFVSFCTVCQGDIFVTVCFLSLRSPFYYSAFVFGSFSYCFSSFNFLFVFTACIFHMSCRYLCLLSVFYSIEIIYSASRYLHFFLHSMADYCICFNFSKHFFLFLFFQSLSVLLAQA